MLDMQSLELLLRLIVAVVLGGVIGLERGGAKHAAGLRTHIILCLGAASVMVVSECLVIRYEIPKEIMRMGAQIISGVGFLGAGNIIVNGGQVHGITTATGLWTTACVGIAAGSGNYLIAVFMVILMMFVMLGLRSMSQKIRTEQINYLLKIEIDSIKNTEVILNRILSEDMEISNINIETIEGEKVILSINITLNQKITSEELMNTVSGMGALKECTVI
ncbi:MAG: MgtC/SapB family protein [Clostridia bacterium]|nr:MgtC/SapB family protein [Clostridia bacterium]